MRATNKEFKKFISQNSTLLIQKFQEVTSNHKIKILKLQSENLELLKWMEEKQPAVKKYLEVNLAKDRVKAILGIDCPDSPETVP